MPPRQVEARVERFIRSIFHLLLLVLLALGAPFVFSYRSVGPVIGPYSIGYLLGVVAPFAGVAALILFLGLARRSSGILLEKTLGQMPARVAGAALVASLIVVAAYSLTIHDIYVSVLILILFSCVLAAVGAALFRSVNLLLAALPLLMAGIVLFGVELPGFKRSSLLEWGQESTFAFLFPTKEPFIGQGGRLRPGLNARMRAPEYGRGARIITNAAGFRNEQEFAPEPPPGEIRVLSLGDSFSIGFCADQDAFFGSYLEGLLEASAGGGRVRVMNAEVSDPAYGLYYLQKYGMRYHPALVIYGLSGNDVIQGAERYGPDRLFTLDAAGHLTRNPRFEPLAEPPWVRFRDFTYPTVGERGSETPPTPPMIERFVAELVRFRLFYGLAEAAAALSRPDVERFSMARPFERADGHKRLIDGTTNLGFFYRKGGAPIEATYAGAFDLLAAMDRTAREGGARFLLFIHPWRYQVQPADWEVMRRRWGLDDADFDLRLYNRRLGSFCAEHGMACCDPTDALAQAARERNLYLPAGDSHNNRDGHRVAAKAAASCIKGIELITPSISQARRISEDARP